MAERLNKPGNRSVATIDSKKEKWFKQMQQLGHIPTTYASLDDLTNYVIQLKNEGKTSAQISEATGADYRNVISNPMFQPSLSSSGSLRGMDMRAAREDTKPDEQLYMRDTFGPDFEKDVRRLRELEWGNKKPRKGENVAELEDRIYNAIRKASDLEPTQRSQTAPEFESAKTQADRSRDRLHAAFGKSKAAQTDRGHGVSAMDGAGVGNSNLEGEWGMGNRGHGSTPRYPSNDSNITKQRGLKDVQDPLAVLRSLNMSANDLQALGDGYLRWMGYDINPKRYSGNYLAADETYREMERPEITGKNNSTGNPQVTTPVEPNNVTAASIEWRDRRLEDAAQQRAVEIELETGVDSKQALAQARSEMNNLSYSKSFLYNTSNATANSGPVRSYNVFSPEQHSNILSNNTGQGARRVIAQQASAAGAAPPVKTPKRIPELDIKGGLGGAALGAGLAYLMGDNASQAAAGSIPIVSDIESTNTGVAERAGTNIFVDPRTNRLMPTDPSQVGMGLAYLNGKPVAVPYGSVAGTKSNGQILQEAGQQIVDVNRDRLQRATQSVVGYFQPKPIPAAKPKPIGNGNGGITKPSGASSKPAKPLLSLSDIQSSLKSLGILR